jgi:hypothetical protein
LFSIKNGFCHEVWIIEKEKLYKRILNLKDYYGS